MYRRSFAGYGGRTYTATSRPRGRTYGAMPRRQRYYGRSYYKAPPVVRRYRTQRSRRPVVRELRMVPYRAPTAERKRAITRVRTANTQSNFKHQRIGTELYQDDDALHGRHGPHIVPPYSSRTHKAAEMMKNASLSAKILTMLLGNVLRQLEVGTQLQWPGKKGDARLVTHSGYQMERAPKKISQIAPPQGVGDQYNKMLVFSCMGEVFCGCDTTINKVLGPHRYSTDNTGNYIIWANFVKDTAPNQQQAVDFFITFMQEWTQHYIGNMAPDSQLQNDTLMADIDKFQRLVGGFKLVGNQPGGDQGMISCTQHSPNILYRFYDLLLNFWESSSATNAPIVYETLVWLFKMFGVGLPHIVAIPDPQDPIQYSIGLWIFSGCQNVADTIDGQPCSYFAVDLYNRLLREAASQTNNNLGALPRQYDLGSGMSIQARMNDPDPELLHKSYAPNVFRNEQQGLTRAPEAVLDAEPNAWYDATLPEWSVITQEATLNGVTFNYLIPAVGNSGVFVYLANRYGYPLFRSTTLYADLVQMDSPIFVANTITPNATTALITSFHADAYHMIGSITGWTNRPVLADPHWPDMFDQVRHAHTVAGANSFKSFLRDLVKGAGTVGKEAFGVAKPFLKQAATAALKNVGSSALMALA